MTKKIRCIVWIIIILSSEHINAKSLLDVNVLNQAASVDYKTISNVFQNGYRVTVTVTMESREHGELIKRSGCTNTIREEPNGDFWFTKSDCKKPERFSVKYLNRKFSILHELEGDLKPQWVESDDKATFIRQKEDIFNDWKHLYEKYKMLVTLEKKPDETYVQKNAYVVIGSLNTDLENIHHNGKKVNVLNLLAKIEKNARIPLEFILNVDYTKKDETHEIDYSTRFRLSIDEDKTKT